MKIKLEKYNQEWTKKFNELKTEIRGQLSSLNPVIEHIGSTSVPGLSAKPIIDILVGVRDEDDLDKTIAPLTEKGYIYYEKYNTMMPYRRFFVKFNNLPAALAFKIKEDNTEWLQEINDQRLAHVHVLQYDSFHWKRHVAFRDYLKQHDMIKTEYQELKTTLTAQDWKDGNEYNAAKNNFIKEQERKAIEWYNQQENRNQLL